MNTSTPPLMACQTEAARHATRRGDNDQWVRNMRANALKVVVAHLAAGHPGVALFELNRTFQDQARALGLHLHENGRAGSW